MGKAGWASSSGPGGNVASMDCRAERPASVSCLSWRKLRVGSGVSELENPVRMTFSVPGRSVLLVTNMAANRHEPITEWGHQKVLVSKPWLVDCWDPRAPHVRVASQGRKTGVGFSLLSKQKLWGGPEPARMDPYSQRTRTKGPGVSPEGSSWSSTEEHKAKLDSGHISSGDQRHWHLTLKMPRSLWEEVFLVPFVFLLLFMYGKGRLLYQLEMTRNGSEDTAFVTVKVAGNRNRWLLCSTL